MTKKEEAEFSVLFISIKIMLAGWLINLKAQSSSTVKIFSGFIFIVYFFSLSYAVSWIWTQVENLKHTLWTALWSWTPSKQCVIKTEKIFLRSFSREIIKKRKPEWDTKLVDIYHDASVKMNKKTTCCVGSNTWNMYETWKFTLNIWYLEICVTHMMSFYTLNRVIL